MLMNLLVNFKTTAMIKKIIQKAKVLESKILSDEVMAGIAITCILGAMVCLIFIYKS